jgi:hypothetical protein
VAGAKVGVARGVAVGRAVGKGNVGCAVGVSLGAPPHATKKTLAAITQKRRRLTLPPTFE